MNGNRIGSPNVPTLSNASGVWNLTEVKLNKELDIWP
jgi:hypothetical protein